MVTQAELDSEIVADWYVRRLRFKQTPNENIDPRDVLEMTAKIMNVKTLSDVELNAAASKLHFGDYKFKSAVGARSAG